MVEVGQVTLPPATSALPDPPSLQTRTHPHYELTSPSAFTIDSSTMYLRVECGAEEEAHAGRRVSKRVLIADELQLHAQAQLPPRPLERVVQREPALQRMWVRRQVSENGWARLMGGGQLDTESTELTGFGRLCIHRHKAAYVHTTSFHLDYRYRISTS